MEIQPANDSQRLLPDACCLLPGRLIVISGPSGVGKSTVTGMVVTRTGVELSVSATTRPPRPGEVDGKNYHFVSSAEFQRMIDADELLEWADVFGNRYGTPAGPVRRAVADGRTIILEIDVQGGVQVARKMPQATFVLILPPSDEELARRLRGRGTESDAVVARRLAKAQEEIRQATASGVYTIMVVNDDLEKAVGDVVAVVTGAKR
jgi:guanylate kinase